MKLPASSPAYTQKDDQTARSMLERADAENHKRNVDIEVSPARLIIKSADGRRWDVHVDNSGNVKAQLV
jgi:hypothetical protein